MERHRDNIGVLRLLFASLVIVGHAPEMIDGDRHREPLTMLFHTMSLGELAVDAFFLISGYLITMSWLRSRSPMRYLERRALRIYPAFILAFIVSVFVLGPFVGAEPWRKLAGTALQLATLGPPPDYPGQLVGLPYPRLNASMWTIAYEFRAYLLVAALGMVGLLRRRGLVLALTCTCLGALAMATLHPAQTFLTSFAAHHSSLVRVFGDPKSDLRFNAAFLVGACGYLWRDELARRIGAREAAVAAAVSTLLLFRDPDLAEIALITVGGFALFWLAFKARLGPLQSINDSWDISYGVYLYGWPIATALRWADRGISPWTLAIVTLPLAALAGAASWWGLEKRTKDLARSRSAPASIGLGADGLAV